MTTAESSSTGPGGSERVDRVRVRAPELAGRGWLNTGGRELTLAGLRGRVVVLDFWTFCCVNCLHVLDELRPLEQRFGDDLVVIGVHSPKFVHEADPDALAAAVERYAVHHPVLDDPELVTWQEYAARAWPTLVVIDPEGYVVAQMSGEGHGAGLASLVAELLETHRERGTLRAGAGVYVPPEPVDTDLRFPGAVLALPERLGGGLLVADTAHHAVVRLDDGDQVTARIGGPERGAADGGPADARFAEPQGLVLLPETVAAVVGYDVVVADSVNHTLRGVRLRDGRVTTVAGTGSQLRERPQLGEGVPAPTQALSTPWGVAWFEDAVLVAMAGLHQLWSFDPVAGTVAVVAGTTSEGLRDDLAAEAVLAQPSGLAASADGTRVWFADSETSAVRWIERRDGDLVVRSAVGTGLFDFGFRDGSTGQALLQHPLGVAELPDGSVVVADTYNGALRRIDVDGAEVSTLVQGLAEPADVVVVSGGDVPHLVVVESAAHRVTRLPVPARARTVSGPAHRTQRPVTDVAPGELQVRVRFVPPAGQKLDDRFGDPTRLVISATPPELLGAGGGPGDGLQRSRTLSSAAGEGVLHVSVQAAACDGDPETGEVPEFAACHLYQQDWGIPIRVRDGGPAELVLDLRGT